MVEMVTVKLNAYAKTSWKQYMNLDKYTNPLPQKSGGEGHGGEGSEGEGDCAVLQELHGDL